MRLAALTDRPDGMAHTYTVKMHCHASDFVYAALFHLLSQSRKYNNFLLSYSEQDQATKDNIINSLSYKFVPEISMKLLNDIIRNQRHLYGQTYCWQDVDVMELDPDLYKVMLGILLKRLVEVFHKDDLRLFDIQHTIKELSADQGYLSELEPMKLEPTEGFDKGFLTK